MQEISQYFRNCLHYSTDAKGFYYPSRFFPEQAAAYQVNAIYRIAFRSQSQVCLGFKTNAERISFVCKPVHDLHKILTLFTEPMTLYQVEDKAPKKKPFHKSADANALGTKQQAVFELLVDQIAVDIRKPKKGKVEFLLNNPDHSWHEVRIYFPYTRQVGVKDLWADGELQALPPKDTILCLGDSITQGANASMTSKTYVFRLAQYLNADTVNQGVSGYVYSEDALNGLENLPFRPKLVTSAYGTNDWQWSASEEKTKNRIKAYLKKLHTLFPDIPIFILTPLWRADEETPLALGPMPQYRDWIAKEADHYENMYVVDGAALISHDARYLQDGMLHPNDAGFEHMAKGLAEEIIKVISDCRA